MGHFLDKNQKELLPPLQKTNIIALLQCWGISNDETMLNNCPNRNGNDVSTKATIMCHHWRSDNFPVQIEKLLSKIRNEHHCKMEMSEFHILTDYMKNFVIQIYFKTFLSSW